MNMTLLTEGVLVAIMKELSLLKSASVICFVPRDTQGRGGRMWGDTAPSQVSLVATKTS